MVKIHKILLFIIFIPAIMPVSVCFAAKPCSTDDPIVVTEKKIIDFGEITSGFGGGTIDTSGSTTGNVAATGGQVRVGQVTIEACKDEIIYYSFIDGTISFNGYSMNVNILTSAGSMTMSKSKETLDIEAQLTAGSLQEPGDYTGTYTIIVDY